MRIKFEYQYIQDEDGYYHEVIGGSIVKRKFKTRWGLKEWVTMKHQLKFYGWLVIAILALYAVSSVINFLTSL